MSKSSLELENIKRIFNDKVTATTLIILVFFDFFITLSYFSSTIPAEALLLFHTNLFYLVAFLCINLVNVLNIYNKYMNNYSYIIRFKDKKVVFKNLILNVILYNIVFFMLSLIIIMIGVNLLSNGNISTISISYGIPYFVYMTFYLLRFLVIIIVISIIEILLTKMFSKDIAYGFNIIILLDAAYYPISVNMKINSIADMNWLISSYFRIYKYSSFTTEILCSLTYILVTMLVIYILFSIAFKVTKE